jgi:hypothetical protein
MATVTASARSRNNAAAAIMDVTVWAEMLATGLDEVLKKDMEQPIQGLQFFRERSVQKKTNNYQSVYGLGLISQNDDAEALPVDEKGIGFDWSVTNYVHRGSIAITRELKETEQYGTIGDMQSDLIVSARNTVEYVCADAINRALGTSGAPFLCEDGMYLIDSARPNAYAPAGAWSNLESTSALTLDAIFNAALNFRKHTNKRGYLASQKLMKVIIRPDEEKTMFELAKSNKRPADAMNAANWAEGIDYMVYDYMTTQQAMYVSVDPKSAANQLVFEWRVTPQVETFEAGDNPDVIKQRVRAAWGIGCGRPDVWRGGALS